MISRLIAAVLLIGGVALSMFGIDRIRQQYHANHDYVETDGTVLMTRLDFKDTTRKGRTTRSFKPFVRYEYQTPTGLRRNETVRVEESYGSQKDADAVLARFPVGAKIKVYYDPKSPYDQTSPPASILLRDYSLTPYLMTLGGVILAAFSMALPAMDVHVPTGPPPAVGRHYVLRPKLKLTTKRNAALAAVAILLVGLAAPGHFFLVSRQFTLWPLIVGGAYLVATLVVLMLAVRAMRISRATGEAEVSIRTATIKRDEPTTVRVAIPVRAGKRLRSLVATLACNQTVRNAGGKGSTTTTVYTQDETLLDDVDGNDFPIEESAIFTAPPGFQPSTVGTQPYPHASWEIRLKATFDGAPPYAAEFPVLVE